MGRKRVTGPVKVRSVAAVMLVTVVPDSRLWSDGTHVVDVEGCIVRVCPPASATDQQIADVVAGLKKCGAAVVKVGQREAGEVVAAPAVTGAETRPMRRVVMDRFDAAKNVADRPAVKQALEDSMDDAGL